MPHQPFTSHVQHVPHPMLARYRLQKKLDELKAVRMADFNISDLNLHGTVIFKLIVGNFVMLH